MQAFKTVTALTSRVTPTYIIPAKVEPRSCLEIATQPFGDNDIVNQEIIAKMRVVLHSGSFVEREKLANHIKSIDVTKLSVEVKNDLPEMLMVLNEFGILKELGEELVGSKPTNLE
jgi:hypothetical protein